TGATISNTLDATLDSILVLGNYQVPSVGNPSGNVLIVAPMSYLSSTAVAVATNKVEVGSVNNAVVGLEIVTSSVGIPVFTTSIDINLNGVIDTADIRNIRVWYTGASSTFATTTQFGTTRAFAPAAANPFTLTVTGSQALLNGNNYFWVTYDVKTGASVGNFIDGEITTIRVADTARVPTISAPSGNRQIRSKYCTVSYSSGCSTDFIARVQLGSIDNATGCTGPLTYYNAIPAPQLPRGTSQTITLTYGPNAFQTAFVWIDWNDDGDYSDVGEDIGMQTPANAGANGTSTVSFMVPISAPIGICRMRIRGGENVQPLAHQSCGASGSGYGEAEEYNIEVVPTPPPTVYTWNQTSPADFNTASNWTPARSFTSFSDKLVFNMGGNITVNNVVNQTISSFTVSGSTNVELNSAGGTLVISDSLNLDSGNITPSSLIMVVGTSAAQPGMVTSGPGRIRGSLTRWIAGTPASYSFPIASVNHDRLVVLNYTTVPATLGTITASFYPNYILSSSGLPLTSGIMNVNKQTPNGLWTITVGNGLSGGTYDISLNADSMVGITNVASLVMLHRINSGNPWTLQGTHVTTTGTAATPVLSRTGVSVYGIWSFGSDSTMNPLPVTLTQLTATPAGKNVQVSWTTASELNNHGFDVERSLDGRTFEKVTFVRGAGNSNKVLNYSFTDEGIFNKATVWYYRLRQVDFDGKFEFSPTVRVNSVSENLQAISVSPNPYTDNFNISVFAMLNGAVSIELVDIQGRVVATSHAFVIEGANAIAVKEGANLKAGIYFARIYMNGEMQVVKLVKD
ncbi:MAG: GEVED domain-containing protein, partial [Bacteroidia bacterium]|nr:GEVED domain-containing protein [Bacteroidia bacterium]